MCGEAFDRPASGRRVADGVASGWMAGGRRVAGGWPVSGRRVNRVAESCVAPAVVAVAPLSLALACKQHVFDIVFTGI